MDDDDDFDDDDFDGEEWTERESGMGACHWCKSWHDLAEVGRRCPDFGEPLLKSGETF